MVVQSLCFSISLRLLFEFSKGLKGINALTLKVGHFTTTYYNHLHPIVLLVHQELLKVNTSISKILQAV